MDRKTVISLAVFVMLLISIPITAYLVKQQQILKSKAAENKEATQDAGRARQPEYKAGEILVKFKVSVSSLMTSPGTDLNRSALPLESVQGSNEQTQRVLNFLRQNQITGIEKVFKDAGNPQQEVAEFKGRFPERAPAVKPAAANIDLSNIYKLSFNEDIPVLRQLQVLAASPDIEYAEPNFIFKTNVIPNDPYYLDHYPDNVGNRDTNWNPSYDYLWGLKKINIEPAWDRTTGSENIIIAVVDTGVDYNHPELAGRVIKGRDFVNNDDDPMDDMGHGTHVAGTINAVGNNGQGIVGASWGTKILAVKALDARGTGRTDQLASAVNYAAQQGARVVNASWGGPGNSRVIKDAVDNVSALGVIFVAAAGNSNDDSRFYTPNSYRNVISVGSSDINDQKSDFSNYIGIDFLAPGGNSAGLDPVPQNILSLRAAGTDLYGGSRGIVNNNYLRARGTSMAAPLVSGVVGLLLSQNSSLTREEVRTILKASSDKVDGGRIWTPTAGYGRINIGRGFDLGNRFNVARIIQPDALTIFANEMRISFLAYGQYFSRWVLEYGRGIEPSQWQVISESSSLSTIVNPISVPLNVSSWQADNYTLRLRVLGNNGVNEVEDRAIILKSPPVKWNFTLPSDSIFISSSPAIADLDNDGRKEVIVTAFNKIYILNSSGALQRTILLADNRAQERVAYQAETAAIADIDATVPGKEILVATMLPPFITPQSERRLRMFYADGRENTTGWPVSLGTGNYTDRETPPKIIDLDGDGQYEILAAYGNKVYVLNKQGIAFSGGWPKTINNANTADVFGGKFIEPRSNQLQILTVNNHGEFTISNLEGSSLRSFDLGNGITRTPVVILSDLDNDGLQEIIVKYTRAGMFTVAVFRSDGVRLWEKPLGREGFTADWPMLAVSDLNGSGNKEIVVSDEQKIYYLTKEGDIASDSPQTEVSDVFGFAVGDSDGNNRQEVYYSHPIPAAFGVLKDGRISLRINLGGAITFIAPVVDDIDGDNHLELIIHSSFGGPLQVFDLGEKNNSSEFNLNWPKYLFNEQRIGSDGICLKLYCDVNNDNREDTNDGDFVLACRDRNAPLGACRKVDARCDDRINASDIEQFTRSCPNIFNTPTPTPSPSAIPSSTPTPILTISEVLFDNQILDLSGTTSTTFHITPQEGVIEIPVNVTYSSGSSRNLIIRLNYLPPMQTESTSYGAFSFSKSNGEQELVQSVIKNGNSWSRVCTISDGNIRCPNSGTGTERGWRNDGMFISPDNSTLKIVSYGAFSFTSSSGQKVAQSLVAENGNSWSRICTIIADQLSCPNSGAGTERGWVNNGVFLAPDSSGAKVISYGVFSYVDGSGQKIVQSIIAEGGNSWSRTCTILEDNIICPNSGGGTDRGWANSGRLRTPDGSGAEVTSYSAFSFTAPGGQKVVQSIVTRDGHAYSRTCDILGGEVDWSGCNNRWSAPFVIP